MLVASQLHCSLSRLFKTITKVSKQKLFTEVIANFALQEVRRKSHFKVVLKISVL